MNKKHTMAVFLLAVLSFSFAPSDYKLVSNPEVVLKKLKTVADKTYSIASDYKEEKYLAAFKKPQVSTGKFYYEKDNKMRWEQVSPFEYIILLNGKSLRIRDNGKEVKIPASNKVALKVNEFMMSLIEGDYQSNKDLKTQCFESLTKYLIELVPLTKPLSKTYTKLELYFSKKDSRLENITFYEKGGDKKIVTFTNQIYNPKVMDGKLFLSF